MISKILEENDLSILETFKSMFSTTDKIDQRTQDQYLRGEAKQLLKTLPHTKKTKTLKGVCDFHLNLLTC